jgi:hypothetical protein
MSTSGRVLALAGILAIASGVLVAPARAMSDPFIGSWSSTDVDGSHQILTVGGGNTTCTM